MNTEVIPGELAFIEDGYTRPVRINAWVGMYPEVNYKDRPMTVEQRSNFMAKWRALPEGEKRERLTATFLNQHIVDWDLKRDKEGNPAEKSAVRMLKLTSALFARMADITLFGIEPGDLPAKLTDQEKDNRVLLEAEAAIDQSLYADKDAEQAAKN